MKTIFRGSYAATIHPRKDGGFEVLFLYNAAFGNLRDASVWSRKTYKTQKKAESKVEKFFADRGAA